MIIDSFDIDFYWKNDKKREKKRFFLLFLSFFTHPNSGMPKACQKGLKKKLYAQKIQTKKVKIECNPYKKSMPFCLQTVGGNNTNTTLTLNLRQKNSFLYGLPSIYATLCMKTRPYTLANCCKKARIYLNLFGFIWIYLNLRFEKAHHGPAVRWTDWQTDSLKDRQSLL